MYGLIGKMTAVPGQRDTLINILMAGIHEMPGCLSYVVARDPSDADAIWITEVWDSEENHRASLSLPQIQQAIAQARPLIAGFSDHTITEPVGGHGLSIPYRSNRSMPTAVVIPELAYPDVREAVEWLCRVFGFSERLQIGSHRAQLTFGDGAVIVTAAATESADLSHAVMVRVADVDSHYEQARRQSASISHPPTDYPYGERQYTAVDLYGRRWTFSQTIADIDPAIWGGQLKEGN
jgi:quinol monooxygenase YgiN/uncharacterized glyoxalase superfamily protein PhnB